MDAFVHSFDYVVAFPAVAVVFVVQPSLADFVLVSEVARDPDRDLRIQIVISGQLTDRVGSVQDTALL